MGKKRVLKRKKWRSHRKLCQILFAFGMAGLFLGVGLVGYFFVKGPRRMMLVGLVYVSAAGVLLAIRGVLQHLDEFHRRRRQIKRCQR